MRTNIIVLDACRTPFRRGEAVTATNLALFDPGLGGYVALSALPGQKADDNSSERNGLFTKYLLQQIPQSGQSIKEAFDWVKERVYAASNQIPPEILALLRRNH